MQEVCSMQKASILWVTIGLAIVCFLKPSIGVGQTGPDPEHSWTYSGQHGPEHWAELSPEFATCATGKEQSPIDIAHSETVQLQEIRFDYHASPLKIIDNGHSVQVDYAPGSTITLGDNSFIGSLTTPPCSEAVTWYVLRTPISSSRAQIDRFAEIYLTNARPVQPLHRRVVSAGK
jgi:carbonic anhydrase